MAPLGLMEAQERRIGVTGRTSEADGPHKSSAMKVHHDATGDRYFPVTRWTIIGYACDMHAPERKRFEALDQILRIYTPALQAHLSTKMQLPKAQVVDIVQGFLCDKVIKRNLLSAADRRRGKLRQLLRVALDRYAISVWRKPGERLAREAVPLEELAEMPDEHDPASSQMDVEWARNLIEEAIRRVKESCEASKRSDIWFVFEHRLLKPSLEGTPPMAYEDMIRHLVLNTPAQAFNLLGTAKRAFERALRDTVKVYAPSDNDVETEVADIRGILRLARFVTVPSKEGLLS